MTGNRTTLQFDQVPDAEAFADFAQVRAGGRKETAQQLFPAKPLYPALPPPAATTQPLEDPGLLRGD